MEITTEATQQLHQQPEEVQQQQQDVSQQQQQQQHEEPNFYFCDRREDIFKGGIKFVCFCTQYCRLCDSNHVTDENLKKHFSECHPEMDTARYECGICMKFYREANCLKQHLLDHTDEERLALVEKMRPILSNINPNHIRLPHKVVKCRICNKNFVKDCYLKLHMNGIHNASNKPFLCCHCGQRFNWVRALVAHEETHGERKALKCDNCDECFTTHKGLRKHQKKHEEGFQGRFSCVICHKKFNWRNGLTRHMRLHTGKSHVQTS